MSKPRAFSPKDSSCGLISIVTVGTFHNFDVASALARFTALDKIYTLSDPIRVIKYRGKTPFRKIDSPWYPFFKRGGNERPGDREKIRAKIRRNRADNLLCMVQWALEAFEVSPNTFKILDIDHFNWRPEIVGALRGYDLKRFDLSRSIDPNKFIMQYYELEMEYSKRGIVREISLDQMVREARELEKSDLVLVPVSYVKEVLIEAGFPRDKIYLLPYGYDPRIFFPLPAPPRNQVKKILFGGTVSIRKGWYYLKEIINNFTGDRQVQFIIAGRVAAEVKDDFNELISTHPDRVAYLGQLSQKKLAREMRRSDIFIFPSVLEGFGLTVLQALACGTPVIASRATCGVDFIEDGVNGLVIDKNNTEAWIDGIRYFIGLDRTASKSACLSACRSVKEATWPEYVKRLLGIISGGRNA